MALRPGELQGILQAMYEANNTLTPELVLAEASATDHPLHHRFTWDDQEAARSHRLKQAGDLIRSVKVVYGERPDGTEKSVRAFVTPRTPGTPAGTYRPIDEVMSDPLQSAILVREARREAAKFQARYGHLSEYADIVAGIGLDAAQAG